MKKILELITVINRNKTKSISIVGNGNTTKLDKFYHLLTTKKATTDDEALTVLYGDEKNRNSYHKLKHQLKERLYNTAFFVDAKQAKFSSRKQAYLECQYYLCLANMLNALGARNNMLDVCKKIIRICDKYDFTSEHLAAAERMMNYYSISGQVKEANQLIDLISTLVELQRKEIHARAFWAKITLQFLTDRSSKHEVAAEAQRYTELLSKMLTSISSQRLDYNIVMLEMSVHMIAGKYEKAAAILTPALDKLSKQQYVDGTFFFGIAINLVACYVPLKKYQEGEAVINSIYQRLQEESYNWFKTREMHFILLLHTKRYGEALKLHQDTTTRSRYKKIPAYLQEIWTIYNAYLRILANAGKVPLTKKQQGTPFRITRYLNSLPTFSKDKRGQNVPVLISQIILLLQQGKLDELDDRFEAVGKYRSRYTGAEKNFRGNVFLHMLQQVTKSNFNRPRIETRTAELRALLDTVKIDITSQGYDQEILPYEDLWEILLDAL